MNIRNSLLLFAALVALPSHAALETTVSDSRLDRQIRVTCEGDRLTTLLERLSEETDLPLRASLPMTDTVMVCCFEGTLRHFLDALTRFFGVDKEHPARWVAKDTGYTFQRDEAARQALATLREERELELARWMDQAIQQDNPWLRSFAGLPTIERRHVYLGRPVTKSVADLGGRAALEPFLGQNKDMWGDDLTVTFQMVGFSPMRRAFQWQIREGTEQPKQELTEGIWASMLAPELSQLQQERRWRERYADVTVLGDPLVSFPRELSSADPLPRRTVLFRLAREAHVNLIADDQGWELVWNIMPRPTALSGLLNLACESSLVPTERGPGGSDPGCFWRRWDDVYLVRSLAWPEEEGR